MTLVLLAMPVLAQRNVETVATFASPGSTGNIVPAADGVLYVTGMDDRFSPSGTLETVVDNAPNGAAVALSPDGK